MGEYLEKVITYGENFLTAALGVLFVLGMYFSRTKKTYKLLDGARDMYEGSKRELEKESERAKETLREEVAALKDAAKDISDANQIIVELKEQIHKQESKLDAISKENGQLKEALYLIVKNNPIYVSSGVSTEITRLFGRAKSEFRMGAIRNANPKT